MKKLRQTLAALVTIIAFIWIATLSTSTNIAQANHDSISFKPPGVDSSVNAIMSNDTISEIIKTNQAMDRLGESLTKDVILSEKTANKTGKLLDENLSIAKQIERKMDAKKPDTLHWVDSSERHKSGWFERWFRSKRKASN